MNNKELPLVVIAGPTASGKTALAIQVAKRFGGEIISADSRTIYRGMNIGTAKPTLGERQGIPHWGFDLVEPGERFTAFDFKRYAEAKIAEIRSRGNLPILVGGSGLYVDVVIFDYTAPEVVVDEVLHGKLEAMTVFELQDYCNKNNIKLPFNDKNKRHLIQAIEKKDITTIKNEEPIGNTIVVGITTEKEVLRTRIKERIKTIIQNGVVEETTKIVEKYGTSGQAMTGNIYPLVCSYLDQKMTMSELIDKAAILDWRLAKRQLTWFRRNPFILWGSSDELITYLSDRLSPLNK